MRLLRISARRLRSRPPTASPESRYSPEVGVSRQPRMFMSVDLPEPDGPTTATYSLAAMSRSTPRRASTCMRPMEYALRIPLIEIMLPRFAFCVCQSQRKRSAAENASPSSLVSQRLRGVDAGGATRGEVAGQRAHRAQDQRRGGGDGGREGGTAQELEGLVLEGQGGDDGHEGEADTRPQQPAQDGHGEGLQDEGRHHLPHLGPQGHLHPDLARALLHHG